VDGGQRTGRRAEDDLIGEPPERHALDGGRRRGGGKRGDRVALLRLTRVVIGAVLHQQHAGYRSRHEHAAQRGPPRRRSRAVGRQTRPELIAAGRQVIEHRS